MKNLVECFYPKLFSIRTLFSVVVCSLFIWLDFLKLCSIRCMNFLIPIKFKDRSHETLSYTTLPTLHRRLIYVETTSCVYWESANMTLVYNFYHWLALWGSAAYQNLSYLKQITNVFELQVFVCQCLNYNLGNNI